MNIPEGMDEVQRLEMLVGLEIDRRLTIWHSNIILAQGLLEIIEECDANPHKDLADRIRKIAVAHLVLPDLP